MFGEIVNAVSGIVQENFTQNRVGDARSDAWRANEIARQDAERMWRLNYDAQKEFAQHGLQWRAEDAEAAGVHPVYALGGGAAAFSPSISVGGGSVVPPVPSSFSVDGQDLTRSMRATMTPEQRAEHDLRLQLLRSQIAETDARAGLADSQSMRNYQMLGPGMPSPASDPAVHHGAVPGSGSAAGLVEVKPTEVLSYAPGDTSTASGRDRAWKTFDMGSGRTWWLPSSSSAGAAESLESVSESFPLTWMVIRENMRRNPNFLYENRHLFPWGEELGEVGAWLNKLVDRAVAHPSGIYGSRAPRARWQRGRSSGY